MSTKVKVGILWRDPNKPVEYFDMIKDIFVKYSKEEIKGCPVTISRAFKQYGYYGTDKFHIFKVKKVEQQVIKRKKMSNETTLLVLHKKEQDIDEYFGSIAAIFEKYSVDDIGIAKQSLYNVLAKTGSYENKKIILVRSYVSRSTGYPKGADRSKLQD